VIVIIASPAVCAVTKPVLSTLATDELLEDHGEEITLGNTFVELSDSVPYPNELA
jgi:hypothetical protein